MRPLLALSALIASLLLPAVARAEIIDIDNAELANLQARKVPVIDIRTQAEWEDTGIVADSRLLTFFDERGQARPDEWLAKLKQVAGPDQPVVVICRSGNRTRAVSQFLSQQAGYKTVYNVKSGIKGWLQEKRPVQPAANSIKACRADKTC